MSSAVEPEASDDKILCNYLVAFIDLLGQSERLLRFKHANQIQPDSPQYKEWLKATFGSVKHFREAFFNFIDNVNKPREGSTVPDLFTKTDVRMASASDSIILYTPIHDPDGSRTIKNINSVVAILQALGGLAPLFIAIDKPFRAGVAIGLGLEMEGIGFYGPCLPLAYEMEKAADFPRILIDPYVVEYLDSFIDDDNPKIANRFVKSQAENARALVFKDHDDKWALDFLCESVHSLYTKPIPNGFEPYLDGYRNIQATIASSMPLQVHTKYLLLKEYYDSRASIWLQNGVAP